VEKSDGYHADYYLTAHAQRIIVERRISTAWIDQVLANPMAVGRDKDDPRLCHAFARIAERGDRVLRVVYNESVKPWPVVTAFFDRKASRVL